VSARVDELPLFALVERHAAAGARLVSITFFQQLPNSGQICKTKKPNRYHMMIFHVQEHNQYIIYALTFNRPYGDNVNEI
jgi:hypothetical protein